MQPLTLSKRVEGVDQVDNEAQLCQRLKFNQHALCVLVINDRSTMLPPCLLRYPDLKVLAIVRVGKIGPLLDWLQQGCSDVVQLKRTDNLKHSLSRLIDECGLRIQNAQLQSTIRTLQALPAVQESTNTIESGLSSSGNTVETLNSNAAAENKAKALLLDKLQLQVQDLSNAGTVWRCKRVTLLLVQLNTELETPLTQQEKLSIQQNMNTAMVVDQVTGNTLLLAIPLSNDLSPRMMVNNVKQCLLAVDPQLFNDRNLCINTITTKLSSANVHTMFEKLTKHAKSNAANFGKQRKLLATPLPGSDVVGGKTKVPYSISTLLTV